MMTDPDGWTRSELCSDGGCTEIKADEGKVLLRSSLRPEQIVSFSYEQWRSFVAGVWTGQIDVD